MKMNIYIYKLFLVLFVLLSGSVALAKDLHEPEIDMLNVTKTEYFIKIDLNNEPEEVTAINLFEAEGKTENLKNFTMIKSFTLDNADGYTIYIDDENITITGVRGNLFKGGSHSYYITAVSGNNSSDPSEFVLNNNPFPNQYKKIFFDSDPPVIVKTGASYNYSPNVIVTDINSPQLVFDLNEGPAGATINESTGEINWTPQEKGVYNFKVLVAWKEDTNVVAQQFWSVNVVDCDELSSIEIKLKWKDGSPVTDAYPYIYTLKNERLTKVKNGIHRTEGEYKFENVDQGTYYLFVHSPYSKPAWYNAAASQLNAQAISIACDDELHLEMTIEEGEPYRLLFENSPLEKINVGEEYKYYAAVNGAENVPLNYYLLEGPAGATINNDGYLKWTPEKPGDYRFRIRAEVRGNPFYDAKLDWIVTVTECQEKGSITIKVFDSYQEPLKEFDLLLLRKIPGTDNKFEEIIEFVKNSYFKIEGLDKGTYFLAINGDSATTGGKGGTAPDWMWFNGKKSLENADPVVLNCAEDRIITFILPSDKLKATVAGTVSDNSTNRALANVRINLAGFAKSGVPVEHNTTTDQAGHFYLEVEPGARYLLRASTLNDYSYQPAFYDNASEISSASWIELPQGESLIMDIKLDKREVYQNSMSGVVKSKNNVPAAGLDVIAFLVETDRNNTSHMFSGQSVKADKSGFFEFHNLIPGKYILLSLDKSGFSKFIPGYYLDNYSTVLSWEDAAKIEITDNSIISNKIIVLNIMESPINEYGNINGQAMLKGEGNTDKVYIIGALAYAIDTKGKIRGYNISRNEGHYKINKLPAGQYKLLLDKTGYTKVVKDVILESNQSVNLNVEMDRVVITGLQSIDDNPAIIIYPNPAETHFAIEGLELTTLEYVQLLDNQGKIIKNYIYPIATLEFNTGELTSSIYIIKIKTRAGEIFSKKLIIKK